MKVENGSATKARIVVPAVERAAARDGVRPLESEGERPPFASNAERRMLDTDAEPCAPDSDVEPTTTTLLAQFVAGYGPSISETALVFLISALLVSSFTFWWMYAIKPFTGDEGDLRLGAVVSVVAGLIVGGIAWTVAVLMIRPSMTPDKANPRVFGQLSARHDALLTTLNAVEANDSLRCSHLRLPAASEVPGKLCPPCSEAHLHLSQAGQMLAKPAHDRSGHHQHLPWFTGFAYIDVLRRLHRAEEALILVKSLDDVLAGMEDDRLRLQGSSIDNRTELIRQIDGTRAHLTSAQSAPLRDAAAVATTAPEVFAGSQVRSNAARVRRVINEFRDDRWDSLLQIRSFMVHCSVIAMAASYALFVGGLCGATYVTHKVAPIIITLYFVSGVFAGIFKQIYDASQPRVHALDMFNLLSVQLIITPILSGLSSVLGVLIVGLVVPSWLDINNTEGPIQDASIIFDFAHYPKGLLIALAAGFAPSFVVGRLSKLAEQIGLDIDRTSVGSGDRIQAN